MTVQSQEGYSESIDSWLLAARIESWAGEVRINLIRMLAILLFYGRHLIEVMMAPTDSVIRGEYHLRVTTLVVVWTATAIIAHILLLRRIYPPAMKFCSVLADLMMITILCMIAGGPKTPLVLLYFLAIATAPLRLSLKLTYVATAGAMFGYLLTLGYYAWYLIGFDKYYASPVLRIPRSEEAIVLLALLTAGLLAGQVVRQMRRLVVGYPLRPIRVADGKDS